MKKLAAALVLGSAALGAHAATVGWTFKGTVDSYDLGFVPFTAYVEIDTATISSGPHFEGPGTGIGKTFVRWEGARGGCSGGGEDGYSRYRASSNGFTISSVDAGNDCSVVVRVTGQNIGTGRFENENDPLTQWFDLSRPGTQIQLDLLSSSSGYQAVTVDYTYQMIPEPGSVALFGAGLAAMVGLRRRRKN